MPRSADILWRGFHALKRVEEVKFVIGALLYGVLIIQQLLLTGLVALLSILVSAAWRILR